MKFKYRNLFRNKKGQAMVEFALVLPVLLLILCGIIEAGWLFSNQLMISNLSREGARVGVIYSSDLSITDIENKVIALVPSYASTKVTVTVTYSDPTYPRTGDIIVNVVYLATPLTPVTGIFINGDIHLTSTTVMKLE